MAGLTLFIHLYYPGSWQLLKEQCGAVIREAAGIIITACHDDVLGEISLPADGRSLILLKVPNKGKDIGGKLAAMSCYLHLCEKTDYIAVLHDKVSPQTINADYWSRQLYSPFGEEGLQKALDLLASDARTGIVGAKAFLKNEYMPLEKRFATTNNALLMDTIEEYALRGAPYDFIAGTMFIGRSAIFEAFFSSHPPLEVRERLETGNVLDLEKGTYTHAWERLFCFIAEDKGYTIKGI